MDEQKNCAEVKKSCGMHWMCCWMPMLGGLAFAWGVLSLIFAFVAGADGAFMGYMADAWMWSGLVAGILAISGSKKKLGSCRMTCEDKSKCSSC
jgi:hypothetical protein